MGVHGTKTLVPGPLAMGIWRCCSGLEPMDAHRIKKMKILRRGFRTKKSFLRTKSLSSGGGEWVPNMKAATMHGSTYPRGGLTASRV